LEKEVWNLNEYIIPNTPIINSLDSPKKRSKTQTSQVADQIGKCLDMRTKNPINPNILSQLKKITTLLGTTYALYIYYSNYDSRPV
jgi:hypothetical protein